MNKNNWNEFKNGSLPEIAKLVLVYATETNSAMQVAKWTGEGRNWLTSVRGDFRNIEGEVTHWMSLPEKPDEL